MLQLHANNFSFQLAVKSTSHKLDTIHCSLQEAKCRATLQPSLDAYAAQWFILSVTQSVTIFRCVFISRNKSVSQVLGIKIFWRTWVPPDVCPPRHLSPWPIRNRGTNVQGDTCPGGTLVWGDSCLGGQLSWGDSCPGGTFVRGDSCPGGQLSRGTNVGGTDVGRTLVRGTNVTTPFVPTPLC